METNWIKDYFQGFLDRAIAAGDVKRIAYYTERVEAQK